MLAGVNAVKANATTIWVTGHSLGAAVALLAALDLAKNVVAPLTPKLYTFAGPRAGDDTFKNAFDAAIPHCYRVWNRWDIVPQVPTPPLFNHTNQSIEIDGGFSFDLAKSHSLAESYKPGLLKLHGWLRLQIQISGNALFGAPHRRRERDLGSVVGIQAPDVVFVRRRQQLLRLHYLDIVDDARRKPVARFGQSFGSQIHIRSCHRDLIRGGLQIEHGAFRTS